MASKRIAKSVVDWVAFADSVPKHQIAVYRAFKSRSDGFAAKMNTQSANLPKIDFADFRARISMPGLVDSLEKSYAGVSVPYPSDHSNMVKSIEEQEVNAQTKSTKDIAFLKKEIESLKGLLAKIEAIPGPNNMTYQMAAEYFPDQSRDPINHPTLWPHDSDSQLNGTDPHEIK